MGERRYCICFEIKLTHCNTTAMQRRVTPSQCDVEIDIHMVQRVRKESQVYSLILASSLLE